MLMQYMVVYYLAIAMSHNLAFYIDGSHFSKIQVGSCEIIVLF